MTQSTHRRSLILVPIVAVLIAVAIFFLRSNSGAPKVVSADSKEGASVVRDFQEPRRDRLDTADADPKSERADARAMDSALRGESGALTVEVRRDPDQPVEKAHVLLFDSKTLLGNATTAADGTCSFPASQGDGGILAWIDGRAPVRQATSLSAGRTTIRLHDGARVSGAARLTDGSPARKQRLLLKADRAFFRADDLPIAVREPMPNMMWLGTHFEGSTDDEGRFEFVGLDPSWKGMLCVQRSHWLIESSQGSLRHEGGLWPYESGVALDAPIDGLALTLLDLPAITGRVVTSDGHTPAPRAEVLCIIRTLDADGAGGPPMTGFRADENGRFRLAVDPINSLRSSAWIERHELPRLAGIWIEVTDADGRSKVQREIKLQDPRGPWDLGDIPLAAMRMLSFVVHDSTGRPIAGAVGRTNGWGMSKPTDAEGRGRAEGLPEEASDWIVGAAGFAVTTVALPTDPSETLEVVLAKSNELVVHVRGESGSLPKGIKIQIASESPMFARGADRKPDWGPDRVQASTGSSDHRGGQFGPQGGYVEFQPDAAGRVVLRCFVPSRPFSIRVQGSAGNSLHEEQVAGLGPEEARTIEIVLQSSGSNITGRVVDASGSPIVGAEISLRKDIWWTGTNSDSLGEFRIEGLGIGPFTLLVEKHGYATIVDQEYELPVSAAPIEFRLEAGHQVRVHVVDTAGGPVRDCQAGISDADGEYAHGRLTDTGVFEFPDLPSRNLTFFAFVCGVRYPKEHSALEPDLTIEVPVHGSIEIRLPETIGFQPGEMVRLLLAAHGASKAASSLDLTPVETSTTRIRFGAVLPGEYEARLEQWSKSENAQEFDWNRIGRTQSIVVKAGEETIVDWSQ